LSKTQTVTFPVSTFDEIAEIIRPHRKPQLTEEQKLAAADRFRKYQFEPAAP
jgi:hypothetical protein